MPDPNDGEREHDPFTTFMWHMPLVLVLASSFVMLPIGATGCLVVVALLGWMAGSSVVRSR